MMDFKISTPVMSGDNVVDIKRLYDAFLQQKKAMEFLVNTIDNDLTSKGIQISSDSTLIGTNAANILVNSNSISLNATGITGNSSSITVNSDNIALKVSSDEVISKINLSPEGIKIDAAKVNITGYVTFSDLSGAGQTTINGANITTGTISASRISTDIGYVADTLELGDILDTTPKIIKFSSSGRIVHTFNGSFPEILISAQTVEINDGHVKLGETNYDVTCKGDWDFSLATVTGMTAVFG